MMASLNPLIPAKAGTQSGSPMTRNQTCNVGWVPAFAGMSGTKSGSEA